MYYYQCLVVSLKWSQLRKAMAVSVWKKQQLLFVNISNFCLSCVIVQLSTITFFFNFSDCGFDVNKKYVHKVEELCVGPSTPSSSAAATKKADKKGLFGIGRILSERELPNRKPSTASNQSASEKGKDNFGWLT